MEKIIYAISCLTDELKAERTTREHGRELRKSISRIEQTLIDLQKTGKIIMAKVSTLNGTLTEIKNQSVKAFGEIQAKITELSGKITQLESQLVDADIPADAAVTLAELKVAAGELDDIVPDVTNV